MKYVFSEVPKNKHASFQIQLSLDNFIQYTGLAIDLSINFTPNT